MNGKHTLVKGERDASAIELGRALADRQARVEGGCMYLQGTCPKCGSELSQDRYINGNPICQCGWSHNRAAKIKETQWQHKVFKSYGVFSVVLMAFFVYALQWGGYVYKMPLIQLARVVGAITPAGLQEYIQACLALGKFDKAQEAYIELFQKTQNPEVASQLAQLQTRLGDLDGAIKTYEFYLKTGGKDATTIFHYAEILERRGDIAGATKYYQASLDAKPDVLNVSAHAGLVRILMNQKKWTEAYEYIAKFQSTSEQAKGYLNTELMQLEKQIEPKVLKRLARHDD